MTDEAVQLAVRTYYSVRTLPASQELLEVRPVKHDGAGAIGSVCCRDVVVRVMDVGRARLQVREGLASVVVGHLSAVDELPLNALGYFPVDAERERTPLAGRNP